MILWKRYTEMHPTTLEKAENLPMDSEMGTPRYRFSSISLRIFLNFLSFSPSMSTSIASDRETPERIMMAI